MERRPTKILTTATLQTEDEINAEDLLEHPMPLRMTPSITDVAKSPEQHGAETALKDTIAHNYSRLASIKGFTQVYNGFEESPNQLNDNSEDADFQRQRAFA